jgi:hypothetical protein
MSQQVRIAVLILQLLVIVVAFSQLPGILPLICVVAMGVAFSANVYALWYHYRHPFPYQH